MTPAKAKRPGSSKHRTPAVHIVSQEDIQAVEGELEVEVATSIGEVETYEDAPVKIAAEQRIRYSNDYTRASLSARVNKALGNAEAATVFTKAATEAAKSIAILDKIEPKARKVAQGWIKNRVSLGVE